MKMKHILKYTFSILLLLASLSASSQQLSDSVSTPLKPVKSERYGLRVGADLYRLARTFYDDNYRGLEITADYRYNKKFYIAGELGNVDITVDDEQLNFTTSGSYFKVGFDYNAYENWLDMENMIFIGMRAGVGSFNHKLNSFTIYQPGNYYGINTNTSNQEFNGLSASWLEVVSGLKAEVFQNLFVGFGVQLKLLAMNNKPSGFDNLYIPGFNKTYEGKFGVGFNYTLSYFIPIYKKKIQPKTEEIKK